MSQNAQSSLPVTHLQELISVHGVSNQLERSKQKKNLKGTCIHSVKEEKIPKINSLANCMSSFQPIQYLGIS